MAALRWTKLQDFCLRLGLLKALVAVLPSERRSILREEILSKLDRAVFGRLSAHPELERTAKHAVGSDLALLVSEAKRSKAVSSVADGLLFTSGLSSWGQPIDSSTRSKVLEWGQTVHLVGQGNQITERGLLLKHLMPAADISRFMSGDKLAWNPFRLTPEERIFFLYHLGERDQVLCDLACSVGSAGASARIEADRARALTAFAMRRMVTAAERAAGFNQLLELRTVRELTKAIEAELGIAEPRSRVRGLPPGPRSQLRVEARRPKKVGKKNADHQAIPRFELLVDLGLLEKRIEEPLAGRDLDRARSGWTFYVTEQAARFTSALESARGAAAVHCEERWQWDAFATVVGKSGIAGNDTLRRATTEEAIDAFLASYGHVERRAGHTPFESTALYALANELPKGIAIEMADLHRVLLKMKTSGALRERVGFAAGNEIDKMFILIRPNAHDAVREFVRKEFPA